MSKTVMAGRRAAAGRSRSLPAMSGAPEGASGMKHVAAWPPRAATGPSPGQAPKRRVTRRATRAPRPGSSIPPIAAMMPIAAGSRPRSSRANRYHVAPNTPHRPASAMLASVIARTIGWRATRRRPVAISRSTGSRSCLRRRRRLVGADGSQQQPPRPRSVSRVDGDGHRTADQIWTRKPAEPKGNELRHRHSMPPGRRWRAAGPDAARWWAGRRGRPRRRTWSEPAASRATRSSCGRDSQPPMAASGMSREQGRPTQVGADHHRPPAQAIDPRPGDEADGQAGQQVHAAHEGDVEGIGVRAPGWPRRAAPCASRSAPKIEIVAAVQTRAKAPLRHSERVGAARRRQVRNLGSSSGIMSVAVRADGRDGSAAREGLNSATTHVR